MYNKHLSENMKRSTGPDTYLFPLPAVVISTYDKTGAPNMMTASWTGVVNSNPPMISVSLRKATYSYNLILESKAFTVSIPSRKHLVEMDYVGTKSGRKENKFETTGLTPVASELVNAPYVAEFPVVLECKLVKHDDLGLHTMFIAQVVDIKIDENCILPNGKPDIQAIDPVGYAHGEREYYATGEFLGKANKAWSASNLNKSLIDAEHREVTELILSYYRKLDDGEPLDAFEEYFLWDDFKIVNADRVIDSFEQYAAWYSEVQATLFDRRHIITKMRIENPDDHLSIVSLDMVFQGRTWEYGSPKSKDVRVNGTVEWHLKRDPASKRMKAIRYLVEI